MKNRDERYQTIKEMLSDLKELKEEMQFAAKLERTSPPAEDEVVRTIAAAAGQTSKPGVVATNNDHARPVSSAEFIVSEIKQHKRSAAIILSLLLVAVMGLGYWFFVLRPLKVTTIESIAVLPFVNVSGNPEVEYLSDGMSESLINRLSELPLLSVQIARLSVSLQGQRNRASTSCFGIICTSHLEWASGATRRRLDVVFIVG